jgi:hypothetical protein
LYTRSTIGMANIETATDTVIEYHVGTFTIPGTTTRLPSWQGSAIWQELLPQFVRFLKKTEILQVDNVKQRNKEILFSIFDI